MSIVRFGVSLEKELLEALDNYAVENHFTNRSQAIRQIINNNIYRPSTSILEKSLCLEIIAVKGRRLL